MGDIMSEYATGWTWTGSFYTASSSLTRRTSAVGPRIASGTRLSESGSFSVTRPGSAKRSPLIGFLVSCQ